MASRAITIAGKMTLLPWGSEAFFYFVPVSITFMISVVWGSKILSAAPLETMIVLRAVTVPAERHSFNVWMRFCKHR